MLKQLREYFIAKISVPKTEQLMQRIEDELDMLECTDGLNGKSNLENLYDIILKNQDKQGNKNDVNSVLLWAIGATSKKPDNDSEFLPERRAFARAGFPDIDLDFDYNRRQEIVDYIVNKYGRENVGNIGTYQSLKFKSTITRVGKVLDIAGAFFKGNDEYKAQNEAKVRELLDSSLPKGSIIKATNEEGEVVVVKTLADAYKYFPEFKYYMDKYPDLWMNSKNIEGLLSIFSVHAAGVCISNTPLERIAPLRIAKGDDVATQFANEDLEAVGLIKFDILAIATLTVISEILILIKENYGIDIDITNLPLDDAPTLALYRSGKLTGVFQCENYGMQSTMKDIGVDRFDDIIAAIALYRPGPMAAIPDYCARKRGEQRVDYFHPTIEKHVKPFLEKTYGILCVHEDSNVCLANGSIKKIKKCNMKDKVISLDILDRKAREGDILHVTKTRFGDGVKLTLANGSYIIVTQDHQILTYDGWKEAKDITENDIVAFCNYAPAYGKKCNFASWLGDDISVAYLLGQLAGDGCIDCGSVLAVGNESNADKLKKWINCKFPEMKVYKSFRTRCWYLSISHPSLLNSTEHGNRKTKWHKFLEDIGMKVNCYGKKIPECILSSSDEIRASFLAGLFDSDGHWSKNGVNIATASNDMKITLGRLLQSFGISFLANNNHIVIMSQEKFRDTIGKYVLLKDMSGTCLTGDSCGCVPKQAIRDAWLNSGLSSRVFSKTYKFARSILRENVKFADTKTAKKVGIELGDIIFYKVKKIEIVCDQQFYDIGVKDYHNFIANGIVVHNCYQEQIMQICNVLAGFSVSDGYVVIKGIGKKIETLINKYAKRFEDGCVTNGVPRDVAKSYWERFITPFASYGFNLSHCLSGDMRLKDKNSGRFYSVKELYNIFYQNDIEFTRQCEADLKQDVIINNLPNISLDSYVDGELVEDQLVDIFCTGEKDVYEICLDNGMVLKCTLKHKFYCTDRKEHTVQDILNNNLDMIFEIENDNNVTLVANKMKKCKIILIKYIGKELTYNLTMKSKQHNYAVYDSSNNNNFIISKNSCCYAYLSYITAYLKANYPDEFFCAFLNVENFRKKEDKVSDLEKDLKKFDIEILDKDINSCHVKYKIVKKKDMKNGIAKTQISPSLVCKGLGVSSAEEIEKHRPYNDLRDLAEKTDTSSVDKDAIGSLVDAGFFDKKFKEISKKTKNKLTKENFRTLLQEKFSNIRNDMKKAAKKGVNSLDMFS